MRITANQVTFGRIFLLPLPVYMLIYGEHVAWWVAFSLFVILGATDFVDGMLARKEGATILGSLMDPMADKIFVASIMMSLVALGIFEGYIVSALLLREFLMTALRSIVAIRKETFKTSSLGKLKTIFQMGGAGTLFFTLVLPPKGVFFVCLGLAVPFLLTALYFGFKKRRIPFWAVPVFLAFTLVTVLSAFVSIEVSLYVQIAIIIGLTWASAIDYVVKSFKLLRRTGLIKGDSCRIFWGLVYGILVTPLVADFPSIVLPLLLVASLEFGLGGIDNILAAERQQYKSWPFIISGTAGFIFAITINIALYFSMQTYVVPLSLILLAISTTLFALMFMANRSVFLPLKR